MNDTTVQQPGILDYIVGTIIVCVILYFLYSWLDTPSETQPTVQVDNEFLNDTSDTPRRNIWIAEWRDHCYIHGKVFIASLIATKNGESFDPIYEFSVLKPTTYVKDGDPKVIQFFQDHLKRNIDSVKAEITPAEATQILSTGSKDEMIEVLQQGCIKANI